MGDCVILAAVILIDVIAVIHVFSYVHPRRIYGCFQMHIHVCHVADGGANIPSLFFLAVGQVVLLRFCFSSQLFPATLAKPPSTPSLPGLPPR